MKACLVNARNMRNVPGRLSDRHECRWLQLIATLREGIRELDHEMAGNPYGHASNPGIPRFPMTTLLSVNMPFCVSRQLLLLLVAVLAVKVVFLVLDPYPALMFGDSQSYLWTALTKWIPPDRSFVYGFLLRRLVVRAHSLMPMVYFQTALSAVASWLVAVCLTRYFRARFAVAAVCSLLCAIEPLQLMFERFVLADSVTTFGFALVLVLVLEYFRRDHLVCISGKSEAEVRADRTRRAWHMGLWRVLLPAHFQTSAYLPELPGLLLLAGIQVLCTLLVGLRLSFVPVALVTSFVVPLLSPRALLLLDSLIRKDRQAKVPLWVRARPVLVFLVVSVGVSQLCLFRYRSLYGHLTGMKPAYSYADGCFSLAIVVPLVKPFDYPLARQRQQIFQEVKYPLANIQMRPVHHWALGGLCDTIERVVGDSVLANDLMRQTALNAMKRDPVGVLKLTGYTYADFFDYKDLFLTVRVEEGQGNPPSPDFAAVLQRSFRLDLPNRHFDSITKGWHAHALCWYWFLLTFPVLYPLYFLIRRHTVGVNHLICAMYALMFWLETFSLVERIVTRYLITEAWLTFIMTGSIISLTPKERRSTAHTTP